MFDTQRPWIRNLAAIAKSGVVANVYNRLGLDEKLAENIPKAKRLYETLRHETSTLELSDYTADTIKGIFQNVKDTEEQYLESHKDDEGIRLSTSGNGLLGALVKLREITSNPDTYARKLFNQNYAIEILQGVNDISPLNDKENNAFKNLIDHAVDNLDLVVEDNEVNGKVEHKFNTDLLGKYLNNVTNKETYSQYQDMLDFIGDALSKESYDEEFKSWKLKNTDSNGKLNFINAIEEQFSFENMKDFLGLGDDRGIFDELKGKKSRPATIRDFKEHPELFKDYTINLGKDDENASVFDLINGWVDKYAMASNEEKKSSGSAEKTAEEATENLIENILDIRLDAKNIRVVKDKQGNDKIIDLTELQKAKRDISRKFASTLPGKIAKTTDIINREDAPIYDFFGRGGLDLVGSSLEKDNKTGKLNRNYTRILGKIYEVEPNGNTLIKMANTEDIYTISTDHGTMQRTMRSMAGGMSERKAKNKIFKFFDIGTTNQQSPLEEIGTRHGALSKVARRFTKQKQHNIVAEAITDKTSKNDSEYRERVYRLSNLFSSVTKTPINPTMKRVAGNMSDDTAKELLKIAQYDNEEDMLNALVNLNEKTKFDNQALMSLVRTGARDRHTIVTKLNIKDDGISETKTVFNYKQLLRREAFKEALLKEARAGSEIPNYSKALNAIKQAHIGAEESKNAELLLNWATIQNEGKIYGKPHTVINREDMKESAAAVLKLFNGEVQKDDFNADYISQLRANLKYISDNFKDASTFTERNHNYFRETPEAAVNGAIMMRRGYSARHYALDIVKDINDNTKLKAHTKKFFYQFGAGRKHPEYVTEYTAAMHFFTQRLIDPFNPLGLGASNANTGSPIDQWKFILGKRVLPVAGGITALSYLNYRSRAYFGTSMTGAMANGIAKLDIGTRKILDVVGIGGRLKNERKLNPITQYWFGDNYQNAEERKEYYKNGYAPVRKSRWWSFGSASEFRGGKISYFQPNFVKRANTPWKDIGIYGSEKEKWAHSWIPTPRHPFSTIRRLLDPYWLERKNYYSRPYLETAPLFSSQTPWGAVLNPIIGQQIKPIRRMHKNEVRRGYTDPRDLIRERNERIKQKAIDKHRENVIQAEGNVIKPMKYVPSQAPADGHVVLSYTVGNGRIEKGDNQGLEYISSLPEFSGKNMYAGGGTGTGTGYGSGGSGGGTSGGYSAPGYIESNSISDILFNNKPGRKTVASDIIRGLNISTFKKAQKNFGTSGPKYGMLVDTRPEVDTYTRASERFNKKHYQQQLRLTTSRHDFISDALYSAKQLSGIYGFVGDMLTKDNRLHIRPANAESMSSFVSRFWEADIGGFGGGVMEIARRFFPHENRDYSYVNPVRNLMPDWIPGRFQTGDPYRKVSKGEMRLPGKAYEAMNKLHPDKYGRYGALDRMKILGDVAPWSEEYKIWRKIAKEEVKDKAGLKEIQGIEDRVEKVSKAHEFYNYKFLHNPTNVTHETVKKIENNAIVTSSGKTLTLAGVNGKYNLSQFVQPGTTIRAEYLKKSAKGQTMEASIHIDGKSLNELVANQLNLKKDLSTPMGARAFTNNVGRNYGALMEFIGHAPIPFVHNKLMRIETPIESYENEQVYGSPYSTWEHPIKGFLKPAFRKAWARGPAGQAIALGAWIGAEQAWKRSGEIRGALNKVGIDVSKKSIDTAASIAFTMMNPGAWTGAMLSSLPLGATMKMSELEQLVSAGTFGSTKNKGTTRNFARGGAALMLAGYGLSRSDKPLEATAFGALSGAAFANQFKFKDLTNTEGAVGGAIIGFGISMMRNGRGGITGIKDAFGKYIPKDTKKKRDIEEYFDRLDYIKYTGLYNKAARKARLHEGVNVAAIVNRADAEAKNSESRIRSIKKKMDLISNSIIDGDIKQQLLLQGQAEIEELQNPKIQLKAGKYTRSAMAYREAARSTIYGLDKTSSIQEIMRAVPKSDKDYFSEFIKETDEKKRRKILKIVAPYQRKALQIAWGKETYDKPRSNYSYFRNHRLPGLFWAGWSPKVDTDNVKIKTIKNEGMLLSDFGIYESEGKEPEAEFAPSVGKWDIGRKNTDGLFLMGKIKGVLDGAGLIGVKVAAEPSNQAGFNVIANIKDSVTIADYKIRKGIQDVIGVRMFY